MTISAATRICMIWGDPVEHSLSPRIHNAAYEASGLSSSFVFVGARVTDESLPAAVAGARALGIRALAVTMPLKESIAALVDELDPRARRIGSVNTVLNDGGKLVGFNTDRVGVIKPISALGGCSGASVLVLGAGGAARAAVSGLTELGARVSVYNRTAARAERLVHDLGGAVVTEVRSLDGFDIVVNSTSLGMSASAESSPLPRGLFTPRHVLFEMIYRPRNTPLVLDALECGSRVIDGLEMFLYQAAEQFELVTGVHAPLERMREVLESARDA